MWVNGDTLLDPTVKARFDAMTSTKWKTHLTDAKKERLEEEAVEKAALKEAAREKSAKERKHQSGSKDRLRGHKRCRTPDSEEERAAERQLQEICEARKAQEGGGQPSCRKKAKGKAMDSEELNTDNSSGSGL
ncbi:hypothetical protein B0H14DRAFT_3476648 [Mycena olivaceomarginata]|nr:hypothetical protein B0H14DRAFT_3476648 [Mycena olivaceomarginata]